MECTSPTGTFRHDLPVLLVGYGYFWLACEWCVGLRIFDK
jgi:hypothetical protein